MVVFLITVFVASVYGANRWFRRGSSSCANGQCSTIDVVPESQPTPIVIPTPTPAPMPDNVVLDNTKTKKRNPKNYSDSKNLINQEGSNDLLGPPDSCDCKTCKCKECVCKECKCEKCPGKKVEEKKQVSEVAKPQQTQYEYYESVPRRRGLFGRFRR